VIEFLTHKLTEEPEFVDFGADCASMRERIARFIFTQVASGLEYLHEVALVANRDIKPDNILFTTKQGGTNIYSHDRAQITDFTTAFKLRRSNVDTKKSQAGKAHQAFWRPSVTSSVSSSHVPWTYGRLESASTASFMSGCHSKATLFMK